MRVSVGPLLAAILLVLSVGLPVLEATGRWDRTIQDTGDETIVVTVVLCVGAALVAAGAARYRASLTSVEWSLPGAQTMSARFFVAPRGRPAISLSPPVSLRI